MGLRLYCVLVYNDTSSLRSDFHRYLSARHFTEEKGDLDWIPQALVSRDRSAQTITLSQELNISDVSRRYGQLLDGLAQILLMLLLSLPDVSNAAALHYLAALRVLTYLRTSASNLLVLRPNVNSPLCVYVDADWVTKYSVSGGIVAFSFDSLVFTHSAFHVYVKY